MHDVGKIGIPDYILLKPGKLTPEEFEVMKGHARIGYELLKDSRSEIMKAGAEVAISHHEKFDGTGYPHGLKGNQIPLFGRIVAVADVFDALTSKRPYKEAFPFAEAMAILRRDAGSHFDPQLVDAFARIAEPLYLEISGAPDAEVEEKLQDMITRYLLPA